MAFGVETPRSLAIGCAVVTGFFGVAMIGINFKVIHIGHYIWSELVNSGPICSTNPKNTGLNLSKIEMKRLDGSAEF